MSMRIRVVLLVVGLMTVFTAPVRVGAAEAEVAISGGGWGHGIGMSQYGARGMAEEGKTAAQILNYFYDGTDLSAIGTGVPDPGALWVGLVQNSSEVAFEAIGGPVGLCNSIDGEGPCSLVASPGESWVFGNIGIDTCQFFKDGVAVGDPGACSGNLVWEYDAGTRLALPATGREYARGTIRFRPVPFNTTMFHTSLEIQIEDYLYGIDEMPSSWPATALQSQVIAARTYAVNDALTIGNVASHLGAQLSCWCHLYSDTRDQNYAGWAKESQVIGTIDYGALWKGAVDATAGLVVTSDGAVVSTFYSSSTGGATENIEDVWNTTPRSYLVSKPDPWSQLASNPYGSWTKNIPHSEFAAALGFATVYSADIVATHESGSPSDVRVVGATPGGAVETHNYTGAQLRSTLGLRSHYVIAIAGGFAPPADGWSQLTAGDYTGDGLDDLAYLHGENGDWWVSDSDSGSSGTARWGVVTADDVWSDGTAGDFNGDGSDDLAIVNDTAGSWWVLRGAGAAFIEEEWIPGPAASLWTRRLVGDFTGDGLSDTAGFNGTDGTWWVNESTGMEFIPATWADFSTAAGWSSQVVGDFNGDGRDDIANFHPSNGTWWVSLSTGTGFVTRLWADFSTAAGWSSQVVGDFNGDGRDDIANFHPSNGTWWVSLSTGTGFLTSLWADYWSGTGWSSQVAGDFNADGRDDVANFHPSNGTWWVSLSTGTGFATRLWADFSTATGWSPQIVGDFNGDGAQDIANFHAASGTTWVSQSTGWSFVTSLRTDF